MNLGINLTGAEYGLLTTTASIDYFAAEGFTTVRLPLSWEQLQPSLNGSLDPAFIEQVHTFVSNAEAQGMKVILDLHNYGAYNGNLIGSAETPVSAFADLWGKLATEFATDSNVSFGLMNEPQVATATQWLPAVNAAIAAIRDAGATTQQVLVSGVHWDGGSSWTTTDNASVLGGTGAIVDPAKNFAFEVHQYLDDTSGKNDWVVSETIGVERLQEITTWARETGAKLYLGEFGVASDHTSLVALTNMMNFVEQNGDVWEGGSYFAGGVGWHDYMYGVEPNLGLLDLPQMAVLKNYLDTRVVSTVLANNTVELDTFVEGRSTVSIKDVLDDGGNLLSRTLYDIDGHATRSVSVGADGQYDLSIYSNGASAPTTLEVYDHSYDIVSRTILGADGSKTVTFYGSGEWDVRRIETYSAGAHLSEVQQVNADGDHVITSYTNDIATRAETYDAQWHFVSRSLYDAAGHLTQVQSTDSAGNTTFTDYNSAGTQMTASYTYDVAWHQVSATTYDGAGHLQSVQTTLAGGGHEIDTYGATDAVMRSAVYDSAWALLSNTVSNGDGTHTTSTYEGVQIVKSEIFDTSWQLVSRTSFDEHGKISEIFHELQGGDSQTATYATAGAAYPSTIDTFDAAGHITSRAQVDASGHVTAVDGVNADGSHTVETFKSGSTLAATSETYDSNWHLVTRTSFDDDGHVARVLEEKADGTHVFANYVPGDAHPSSIDTYNAAWQITERFQVDAAGRTTAVDHIKADGSHLVESFQPGSAYAATAETYDASWHLQSRTTYDGAGLVANILHEEANGTHAIATYATPGAAHPATIDGFDANWQITDRVHLDQTGALTAIDHVNTDGTHRVELFQAGSSKAYETDTYSANWSLLASKLSSGDAPSSAATALVAEFDGSHVAAHADAAPAAPTTESHDVHGIVLAAVFSADWALV